MSRLKLIRIESSTALRASSEAWDDLWRRSEVALSTTRATLLAQWLEQFAAGSQLVALAVQKDGRFLAALPMVCRPLARAIPVGALPRGAWSSSGDLLLDPTADVQRVLNRLVAAIRELPWPLLWFDIAPTESPRWRAFRSALRRAGLPVVCHRQFDVGQIRIDKNWEKY